MHNEQKVCGGGTDIIVTLSIFWVGKPVTPTGIQANAYGRTGKEQERRLLVKNVHLGVVHTRACERSVSDRFSRLSAQAFSGMSAHRSAPAHPVFCPLRYVFRSSHMLCFRLADSACRRHKNSVGASKKHVADKYNICLRRKKRRRPSSATSAVRIVGGLST